VVVEADNFPADNYVVQGIRARFRPDLELRPVSSESLAEALTPEVGVLVCSHVNYRSGLLQDLPGLTARARELGVTVVWDLAHSAGVVPVGLTAAGADLAVGCGYKYLCGGPGAPAFLYVRRELQERVSPVLTGWLGHAEPFAFESDYRPAGGIRRQLCGTPAVLAMSALDAALDVLLEAELSVVRRQSVVLTGTFLAEVESECAGLGLELASPRIPELRGSQIAFRHPEGYAIVQALIARGVIGDFRAPDLLRFGFAPHYLTLEDARGAARALGEVLRSAEYQRPEHRQRGYVT
jgi:kynureninase